MLQSQSCKPYAVVFLVNLFRQTQMLDLPSEF